MRGPAGPQCSALPSPAHSRAGASWASAITCCPSSGWPTLGGHGDVRQRLAAAPDLVRHARPGVGGHAVSAPGGLAPLAGAAPLAAAPVRVTFHPGARLNATASTTGARSATHDRDSDNDGIPDSVEARIGSNPRSPDSDGDGLPDGWERQHGLDPSNAQDASADPDGDGLSNATEYKAGENPLARDSNRDGTSDGQDDSDGDGLSNAVEQDLSLDPKSGSSAGNAIPDASEDTDGDGIPNAVEVSIGTDPAVADSDGDGVPDGQADSDGDGLTNAEEVALHLDPVSGESSPGQPDAALDSDGDGLSNATELQMGSNPAAADSDGNGAADGARTPTATAPRARRRSPRAATRWSPTRLRRMRRPHAAPSSEEPAKSDGDAHPRNHDDSNAESARLDLGLLGRLGHRPGAREQPRAGAPAGPGLDSSSQRRRRPDQRRGAHPAAPTPAPQPAAAPPLRRSSRIRPTGRRRSTPRSPTVSRRRRDAGGRRVADGPVRSAAHADRDHHRLGDVRPARARGRRSRRVATPFGEALVSEGSFARRRGPARRAPRRGAPAPEQRGHPSGQHLGAARARGAGDPRRHGLRVARPRARARHPGRLRRPALPGQPPARRLAVHAAHRAGRARARPLDLRPAVQRAAAPRAARRRARGRLCRARRRLLRARRRPALQHADRDPDAHAGAA